MPFIIEGQTRKAGCFLGSGSDPAALTLALIARLEFSALFNGLMLKGRLSGVP